MSDEAYGEVSATNPGEDTAGSGWTTTKQAAKVLGVSRRSVQEYVHRGLLEARVEGEGVSKTFYVSIDSLNTVRNRRNAEATSPGIFADASSQMAEPTNAPTNDGEALRHAIDRLEARTAEAAEYRVRLELTEQAQSTLEEQLAEECHLREEAERERDELRRRLESAQETPQAPETAREDAGGVVEDPEPAPEPQTTARRPWWLRLLGG